MFTKGESVCGPDAYKHGSNVRIRDKSTLRGVFDVAKLFAYCASDTVHIDKEGKPAAGIRCGLSCNDDRRVGIARHYLRPRGFGSRPVHLIDKRPRRSMRHAYPLQRQSAARSSNTEFRPRRIAAQRTLRSILTPALAFSSGSRIAQKSVVSFLLLVILSAYVTPAQDKSQVPIKNNSTTAALPAAQKPPSAPADRPITIKDAVTIFLQQNLQLVAARYDIDIVDAEKLTAGLRPNPEIEIGFSEIPFNGGFYKPQSFSYGLSQTFELGGKRKKRVEAANAESEVARAQFQMVAWQLTNDVKKKIYSVLLNHSLLQLARENQKTFAEIVEHTNEVFKLGEISGLDLQRLEVEKFKFDTDLANSERDYELALRDLRFALGGDYRRMK